MNALLIETGGCETGPAVPKPGDANTVYANCKGRFGVFDKRLGMERRYYIGAANMYGQNPRDLKYRFQRVAPIHVSPHDADTVYMGSQYLHRTRDDGVTWETISPDLTAFEADKQVISGSPITRDITGEEFYSTLYSVRESPLEPGVIWTGANDGPVFVTRDGGDSWAEVTPRGLPGGGRVDSVAPSRHEAGVAYIAVHRYLLGDWKPYIYRAEDYGRRWTLLTDGQNGIPSDHPVRVVREDPQMPGLLYAGTEYGVYVSFDDGGSWQAFQQNLPVTPVTDLKIHRDDVVLSTMGRGFWILDKAAATLRQAGVDAGAPRLFTPAEAIRYRQRQRGHGPDEVPQFPVAGVVVDYELPAAGAKDLRLEIYTGEGELVNAYRAGDDATDGSVETDMGMNSVTYLDRAELTADAGINRFRWDMRARGAWDEDEDDRYTGGPLVPPGEYELRLVVDGETLTTTARIVLDPRVPATGVGIADVEAQYAMRLEIRDLLDAARRKAAALQEEIEAGIADSTRRDAVEGAIAQLVTADGTYMRPGLISQISYLYRMLGQADQQPGAEAAMRLATLRSRFEPIAAL
jgi:hypothetical protein